MNVAMVSTASESRLGMLRFISDDFPLTALYAYARRAGGS